MSDLRPFESPRMALAVPVLLMFMTCSCSGLLRTDRLLHLAWSCHSSCMAGWTFERFGAGGTGAELAGASAALLAGTVKEIGDAASGGSADPWDLAADFLGAAAGAFLLHAAVTGE
ncbi:hypothetical protein GX411_06055 [Candidatus Fermentibacteria bacterium]|nr:hypothetical protein [Candidatus Fermentibacteria bacterium]